MKRLLPGLRFQIVLVLAGTLGVAFGLVALVGLSNLERLDATMRAHQADHEAAVLARLAGRRCKGTDHTCIADFLSTLSGAHVAGPAERHTAAVGSGTFRVAVAPRGPDAAIGRARRFLLVFLLLDFVAVLLLGSLALFRAVVRPVEAIAAQADQVARLDFGGAAEGHQVGRLGSTFRRMVAALAVERARVERQIDELEATNRSLTEAKEGLVRSEKLATVGRLAAGVAHEIGNPLGGLVGYLEILKTKVGDDETLRPLIDGGLDAALRIDQTIRDLLDFSRPAEATRAPFALGETIDDAVRLVRTEKRFAHVTVEVDVAASVPEVVGDRRRFTQVLVNLLLNAGDAMDGEGRLDVVASNEGDAVRVEVRDTGPGLPPGAEDEVFEPFFTTKAPGKGTGLGLAISRRLVESWGGHLTASTREEGGAVFVATLPVSALN